MIAISADEKRVIEENAVAFATVDLENNPNVIGVAYVKVISNNELLITDNYMKQTKENIEHNENVCLAAWDNKWRGYKYIGKAIYHSDGKWIQFIKEMPENEGLPSKGAIIIKVSKIIKLG